jgi:hypothetical protein
MKIKYRICLAMLRIFGVPIWRTYDRFIVLSVKQE